MVEAHAHTRIYLISYVHASAGFALSVSLRETFSVRTELTRDALVAAEFIKAGGVVAFPTETVYGLGADVFNAPAIARIFEAKRRPPDNPLIAHVASIDQIRQLSTHIPVFAESFIEKFFPGPLTVVLPRSNRVPLIATAGLDTIGVRMPRFGPAHDFLSACATPVVAPSANLSGRPSPTTWQAVLEDLDGRIDSILQGDPTEIGLESTVVDCSGEVPVLLRQGAVSLAELQAVVPETVDMSPHESGSPRSPGLRHRHYTPRALVVIADVFDPDTDYKNSAYIGLLDNVETGDFAFSKVHGSVEEYARSLFEFFRECDRREISTIYCQPVPEVGIGAALMDRLRRASAD